MSIVWYGSINNRIDEGKYYNGTFNNLTEGTDITMYHWSDRTCYYITKVVDQKHIFVKEYEVIADHHKEGGAGHQNWLYFKDEKQEQNYRNELVNEGIFPKDMYHSLDEVKVSEPQEWVYRYNKWQRVERIDSARWNRVLERTKSDIKNPEENMSKVESLAMYYCKINEEDLAKIKAGKTVNKYYPLDSVSFGVKDYYYDWEF